VRRLRAQWLAGTLSDAQYESGIAAHIGYAVGAQEAAGLDVLVHGEAERTDMVRGGGPAVGLSGIGLGGILCMGRCLHASQQHAGLC
jgi:methionine synthase II (cobalamin-independent)